MNNHKSIPILNNKKEECCGCYECYSVCPVKAINMVSDKEGFFYPNIDDKKCIRCYKCVSHCSFKKDQNKYFKNIKGIKDFYKEPEVFAVKHKNERIRAESRSGGIFTAISDFVLSQNGVIYGCIMETKYNAVHTRATTVYKRDKMRGSKYIQSSIGDTYKEVKRDLDSGYLVLFTGTSCQIAGLRSFLDNNQYDKLICLDLICHGVPSPKVWKDYVLWQEKRAKDKCTHVDFRNKKDFGWSEHIESIYFESKKRIDSKMYSYLFYMHSILRPSCYVCPYKYVIHPGDITIGDFWGIDKAAPEFDDNKGVSIVLINNDLGKLIFNKVCNEIVFKKCMLKDSMQMPLIRSVNKPSNREEFWNYYNKKGIDFILKKYCGASLYNYIKIYVKNIFMRLKK